MNRWEDGLTENIEIKLSKVISDICKNPLLFVSETDIHFLIMHELMQIEKISRRYTTNCTIGKNKKGNKSTNKYETICIHKEYGHSDIKKKRTDIVILHPEDIKKIDGPFRLKEKDEWILPYYMFELGCDTIGEFETHFKQDIDKVKKSKKVGYVIHIERRFCRSQGERHKRHNLKYQEYERIIKNMLPLKPTNVKIIIALIDIGNSDRIIKSKIKLFNVKKNKFEDINQKNLEKGILDNLKE